MKSHPQGENASQRNVRLYGADQTLTEQQQIKLAMDASAQPQADRVLTAQRTLELANKAYFLYLTQKPAEQAELLRKVLLNCSIDAVSVTATYRKPFDMIFERAKKKEWSGREDLNLRPPGPEPDSSIFAKPPGFSSIHRFEFTRVVLGHVERC
jgi:hypothetical protein